MDQIKRGVEVGEGGWLCWGGVEGWGEKAQKELIPFATAWMELESILLSEIIQMVRDKYHMTSPKTGT